MCIRDRLLNDKAQMGWTTLEHTGTRVPMYAIGAGAWRFAGSPLNNTDTVPYTHLDVYKRQ